jgi:Kef-type K+ transport system membrane component KefB
MDVPDFFRQALIYLLAAVITVPVAKKLGLGSVLGYLVAGVIIGPYILGWTGPDSEKIMHFAEFGVVLMLFLVGPPCCGNHATRFLEWEGFRSSLPP